MDDAERLLAIEEIKQLKARYFRCMDTKDWDGFAASTGRRRQAAALAPAVGKAAAYAVFTPDAVMGVRGAANGAKRRELAEERAAAGRVSRPAASEPMGEDMLRWPEGAPLGEMHGYGHYHEEYEKHDGRWHISKLVLTRLRVDFA
ncbi:MAG: nuclear transport factor 2 family protein [Actinobacteria bacterium]|nr:nuclear transport factor 2 family protein [Actinomycetota bacterium]